MTMEFGCSVLELRAIDAGNLTIQFSQPLERMQEPRWLRVQLYFHSLQVQILLIRVLTSLPAYGK